MESISLQSDSLTQITKLLLNLPSDACTAVSDRLRCGGFMQCGKHQAVSGCLLSPASRSHCFQAVHQQGAEQGGEHPTQPLPKAATAKLHQVSIKLLSRKDEFRTTAANGPPG